MKPRKSENLFSFLLLALVIIIDGRSHAQTNNEKIQGYLSIPVDEVVDCRTNSSLSEDWVDVTSRVHFIGCIFAPLPSNSPKDDPRIEMILNQEARLVIDGGTSFEIQNVIFTNCTFSGNQQTALRIQNSTGIQNVIITNSTFESNSAPQGAAILVESTFLNLTISSEDSSSNLGTGVIFQNNSNTEGGGTLLILTSNSPELHISVDSASFINNTATTDGGAILVSSEDPPPFSMQSIISLSDSIFVDNTAGARGGAICFTGGGTLRFFGRTMTSVFKGNKANDGGAVYFAAVSNYASGFHQVENGSGFQFSNNSATDYGGAIFISQEGFEGCDSDANNFMITVMSAIFQFNSANAGGAIWVETNEDSDSQICWIDKRFWLVENCSFIYNIAQAKGGALGIQLLHGISRADRIEVAWNSAGIGGGIFVERKGIARKENGTREGSFALFDSRLSENQAYMGGAAYLRTETNFTRVVLIDNSALEGGAIYYRVSTTTEEGFLCRGCNITGNRAKLLGGAMYIMQGSVFLEEKTRLEDNIAYSQGGGSAIYASDGTFVLSQSTIVGSGPSAISLVFYAGQLKISHSNIIDCGTLLFYSGVNLNFNQSEMGNTGLTFVSEDELASALVITSSVFTNAPIDGLGLLLLTVSNSSFIESSHIKMGAFSSFSLTTSNFTNVQQVELNSTQISDSNFIGTTVIISNGTATRIMTEGSGIYGNNLSLSESLLSGGNVALSGVSSISNCTLEDVWVQITFESSLEVSWSTFPSNSKTTLFVESDASLVLQASTVCFAPNTTPVTVECVGTNSLVLIDNPSIPLLGSCETTADETSRVSLSSLDGPLYVDICSPLFFSFKFSREVIETGSVISVLNPPQQCLNDTISSTYSLCTPVAPPPQSSSLLSSQTPLTSSFGWNTTATNFPVPAFKQTYCFTISTTCLVPVSIVFTASTTRHFLSTVTSSLSCEEPFVLSLQNITYEYQIRGQWNLPFNEEANVIVQDSEGNQFQILNSSSSASTGFFSLPASNAINSTWQIVKSYTVSLSSGGNSFSPTTIVVISIQWLVALTVGPVSILGLVSVGVWGYYKKRSVDRRKQSLARLLDEQEDQLDTFTKQWEIDPKELEEVKLISSGASGEIWKGIWSEKIVAIKKLKKGTYDSTVLIHHFNTEVELMVTMKHPNIVFFYGAGRNDGVPFLVTDFLPGGNLLEFFQSARRQGVIVPLEQRKGFIEEVAKGMRYMHSRDPPRIHGDLKPQNLLLTAGEHPNVCIAGFGISRNRSPTGADFTSLVSEDEERLSRTTLLHRAPEIDWIMLYGTENDVYSFGIIMYFISLGTGEEPYQDIATGDIIEHALQGERPQIPRDHDWPASWAGLMTSCWDRNPSSRPSFNNICDTLRIEE